MAAFTLSMYEFWSLISFWIIPSLPCSCLWASSHSSVLCLKAWLVLFQWDTSSLVAVLRRFSMSLLTWDEAALALCESSRFLQLNFLQDSGSDPAASMFSTPGWSAMFLELFRSWKQILSMSRALSL